MKWETKQKTIYKFCAYYLQKAEADALIANGKKNDDADADADASSKRDTMKFLNGQTNLYKSKTDTTRTRHYVGSAN